MVTRGYPKEIGVKFATACCCAKKSVNSVDSKLSLHYHIHIQTNNGTKHMNVQINDTDIELKTKELEIVTSLEICVDAEIDGQSEGVEFQLECDEGDFYEDSTVTNSLNKEEGSFSEKEKAVWGALDLKKLIEKANAKKAKHDKEIEYKICNVKIASEDNGVNTYMTVDSNSSELDIVVQLDDNGRFGPDCLIFKEGESGSWDELTQQEDDVVNKLEVGNIAEGAFQDHDIEAYEYHRTHFHITFNNKEVQIRETKVDGKATLVISDFQTGDFSEKEEFDSVKEAQEFISQYYYDKYEDLEGLIDYLSDRTPVKVREKIEAKAALVDSVMNELALNQTEFADKLGLTRQGVAKWRKNNSYPNYFGYTMIGFLVELNADKTKEIQEEILEMFCTQ